MTGGMLLLFFILQSNSPLFVLAQTETSQKIPSFLENLSLLPWWGYVIILVLVVGCIYLISRKLKGKSRSNQGLNHDKKNEPITVRRQNLAVIPGNAQAIGSREEQQDAFGFSDINDEHFMSEYGVLAVLADGMGGLHGGREASHIAVQAFLEDYLHSRENTSIPEKLTTSLEAANEKVLQFAYENQLLGGIGTTLIASVVFQNQLYWLSVGDSRIYLIQGESITQLTIEHKYAKELDELAALGEITQEEAKHDPQRDSLTSFLGLEKLELLDVSMEPIPLQKGDSIILCSDGLYGSVSNEEILEVCRYLPTQEAAEELISIALSKQLSHQDNATVAILTID